MSLLDMTRARLTKTKVILATRVVVEHHHGDKLAHYKEGTSWVECKIASVHQEGTGQVHSGL